MKRFALVVAGLILFFGIVFAVLTILAELSRPSSSIVTSTECDPPCWHGIRPGVSTSWNVLDYLLSQNWVISDSIYEWTEGNETKQIAWKFQRPAGDTAGYAYFLDDKVTAISISTIGSLDISEVVELVGEPNSMVALYKETSIRQWVEISLIYPNKGVLVQVDIDLDNSVTQGMVEITEENPVYRVTYFNPELYDQLLGERNLIDESSEIILNNIQSWSGFGLVRFWK